MVFVNLLVFMNLKFRFSGYLLCLQTPSKEPFINSSKLEGTTTLNTVYDLKRNFVVKVLIVFRCMVRNWIFRNNVLHFYDYYSS